MFREKRFLNTLSFEIKKNGKIKNLNRTNRKSHQKSYSKPPNLDPEIITLRLQPQEIFENLFFKNYF